MSFANRIPIEKLVEQAVTQLQELSYSIITIRSYRHVWNAIIDCAKETNKEYMSAELGSSAMRKAFKIDIYSGSLTKNEKRLRRAVTMLLEFQETGRVIKHKNRYDYSFSDGYEHVAQGFLEYLKKELGLKPETVRNYYMSLDKFLAYCDFNRAKNVKNINSDMVTAYLRTFAGYSKSHINTQIRVLQRFFEFARKNGETDAVFKWPKVMIYKDKGIPNYYKADEIKSILDAVDRANPLGKRDYAILLLAAKYGLRCGDIVLLEFSDIDFNTNQINLTQQKTDKPLSLFLLPDVGWALIDYIKNGRPKSDSTRIFIKHRTPYDGFEHGGSLNQVLQKYVNAAGVKNNPQNKNHFHMLRYSLASDLLRKDIPLTVISGILGHSELNITAKYTRLDFNQLRACALEVPV